VHPFEVSLTGTSSGNGDFVLTAIHPILPPPSQRVSKSLVTLFLAHIYRPLIGARRLRVTEERLQVDYGDGFRLAWSFRRGGAITLVPHSGEALSAE
jgi:propanediol dehydratase small subunit